MYGQLFNPQPRISHEYYMSLIFLAWFLPVTTPELKVAAVTPIFKLVIHLFPVIYSPYSPVLRRTGANAAWISVGRGP